MFHALLPSISHLYFLRSISVQIIQRINLCTFLPNRSLLPPPPLSNFSEEVVLEAIIINLQCCRSHELEKLLPAITENIVRRVILRCRQYPKQALYFFQWSVQNRQQNNLSPLCLDTCCALFHVLIAAKLFNESIDLMKNLMQKDGIDPLDILSSLIHGYVHAWCNLSVYDAVVHACTQLGASNNAYFVIKELRGN